MFCNKICQCTIARLVNINITNGSNNYTSKALLTHWPGQRGYEAIMWINVVGMSSSQIQYDWLISWVSIWRLVDLPRRMFEKTTKMMIGSRRICIAICIIAVRAERSIDFLSLPSLPFWLDVTMAALIIYQDHRNSEFFILLSLTPRYRKDIQRYVPRTSYDSPMKTVWTTARRL